jgi:hypothetical protein
MFNQSRLMGYGDSKGLINVTPIAAKSRIFRGTIAPMLNYIHPTPQFPDREHADIGGNFLLGHLPEKASDTGVRPIALPQFADDVGIE